MSLAPKWARPIAILGLEMQLLLLEIEANRLDEPRRSQVESRLREFSLRIDNLPRD